MDYIYNQMYGNEGFVCYKRFYCREQLATKVESGRNMHILWCIIRLKLLLKYNVVSKNCMNMYTLILL